MKARAGNPGKRKLRVDEPIPKEGRPRCPAFFTDDAKGEWTRLTRILEQERRLSLSDGPALEKLCVAHARWLRLLKVADLLETPLTVTTELGVKPNPIFQMERLAAEQCRKLYNDFGLTPGTRAKMPTNKTADTRKDRLKAKFFGKPTLVKGAHTRAAQV